MAKSRRKSKKSRRMRLNKSRKNFGYKVYGGSNPGNIDSISPTIKKNLLEDLKIVENVVLSAKDGGADVNIDITRFTQKRYSCGSGLFNRTKNKFCELIKTYMYFLLIRFMNDNAYFNKYKYILGLKFTNHIAIYDTGIKDEFKNASNNNIDNLISGIRNKNNYQYIQLLNDQIKQLLNDQIKRLIKHNNANFENNDEGYVESNTYLQQQSEDNLVSQKIKKILTSLVELTSGGEKTKKLEISNPNFEAWERLNKKNWGNW